VKILDKVLIPTERHRYLPPLVYWGVPLPCRELCDLYDRRELHASATGEWKQRLDDELALYDYDQYKGDPLYDDILEDDKHDPRSLEVSREYTLRVIEHDLQLPENSLLIVSSQTNPKRVLAFYSNYELGRSTNLTSDQIDDVLRLIGLDVEAVRPLWYLGPEGTWVKRPIAVQSWCVLVQVSLLLCNV
jgi:hypothetical protein